MVYESNPMNPVRKRKLLTVFFVVSLLATVTALVLYALRQNISLFYTPSQVAAGEVTSKRLIRLGGMVVKGSIVRQTHDLSVQFQLTDYQHTVTVFYKGILPDLFREGQGIVALGEVVENLQFSAKEVLAKHDATYMPPEVKEALIKARQQGAKGAA